MKKARKLPNLKIGRIAAYKILYLSLAGFTVSEISSAIDLPPQTIKRNLKKLWRSLFASPSFFKLMRNYFWIELKDGSHIEDVAGSIIFIDAYLHFIGRDERCSAPESAFFDCINKCPSLPDMTTLVSRAFKIREDLSNKFKIIWVKDVDEFDNYKKLIEAKRNCSLCGIGLGLKERGSRMPPVEALATDNGPLHAARIHIFLKSYKLRSSQDKILYYIAAVVFSIFSSKFLTVYSRYDMSKTTYEDAVSLTLSDYATFINRCMAVLGLGDLPLDVHSLSLPRR